MMSEDDSDQNNIMMCCAACGIAEVDDIKKMKDCADCDLVRYCSVACQKEHRPQHEEACKKRAAELRDELLFKQPDSSHLGDCPICCLHLPLDLQKSTVYDCCSKVICGGCCHADILRDIHIDRRASLNFSCPFCRQQPDLISIDEGFENQRMNRVEANDPVDSYVWRRILA